MKKNQSFDRGRTAAWRLLSALALLGTLPILLLAAPVPWWSQRGVLIPNVPANDYAAANLGQVKNIAQAAAAELNAKLPGGAGTNINNLVTSWQQPPGSGVTRNDYAAINLGQLKIIAKPFYDRLREVGYTRQPLMAGQKYPWDNSPAPVNDYAPANLGQLKQVFAFELLGDTDNNQLPDWWELSYFDHAGVDPNGDEDGDGLSNLNEYLNGTNPVLYSTGGSGIPDGWFVAHGFDPLSHNPFVTDSDGDGRTDAQEFLDSTDPRIPQQAPQQQGPSLASPNGLSVTTLEPGRYEVTWTNNEPLAARFVVERTDNALDWQTVGIVPSPKTSFTNTVPDPGLAYFYRVYAHN